METEPIEHGGREGQHSNERRAVSGELRYDGRALPVSGRAFRLMLWLARHQQRVNSVAPESGQLWLTWKGENGDAIAGDIRTSIK